MKNIIKNLFYVGKDVWLFLYPIATFYLIGKASSEPIIIDGLKSIILFNIVWMLCSIGLRIIFKTMLLLIEYVLKLIGDLLNKKRD